MATAANRMADITPHAGGEAETPSLLSSVAAWMYQESGRHRAALDAGQKILREMLSSQGACQFQVVLNVVGSGIPGQLDCQRSIPVRRNGTTQCCHTVRDEHGHVAQGGPAA